MPSGAWITWLKPPSGLKDAYLKYGDRAILAVFAVADAFCQRLQDDARRNAKWKDRTGNARSGLFAIAEKAAKDCVSIYLSHGYTVDYGVWLELANGGKYAIIMPTLEKDLPQLKKMLDDIFKD